MAGRRHNAAAKAPAAVMPPVSVAVPVAASCGLAFTRAHRHAGVDYQPGDRIVCDDATANLLHHFGVVVEG